MARMIIHNPCPCFLKRTVSRSARTGIRYSAPSEIILFCGNQELSLREKLGLERSLRRFGGERCAHGVEPVGKGFALGIRQAGFGVDEPVGSEGHAAFGDLVGALFEFTGGPFGREQVELGEIDVFLALFDVVRQPPADGLHPGIPGIIRVVGMAVVAGGGQKTLDIRGCGVPDLDIGGAGYDPEVFRLAYELNRDENDQQAKQDFFHHEA